MLRAHLYYLAGLLYGITRLDGFREHVGKGFLNVAVLACPHHFQTQLGMLKIAGGNHHPVNILARQHVFRIFVGLGLEIESPLYLGCAVFPCQAPQIADRDGLDRHFFGR